MSENIQIKLNLFENGLDFVQSGIEFAKKDGKNLKYAIVHLASGVELILKYRLTKEHWSLIFKDIKEAKNSSLESGKFKSVDFDECINRLINIADVEISEKDKRNFNDLKERRNRIIHFNVDESSSAMRSSSLKVMNSLLNFINHYIDSSTLKREEINKINEIKSDLLDFEDFVNKRLQLLSSEINDYTKN